MKNKKIAIIGAGPIGLETALYGLQLGYDVTVFEKGRVGENIRKWGHVTLFSPWEMNHSILGPRLLKTNSTWQEPAAQALLTGREFVASYLEPLADLQCLSGKIHTQTEVVHIARGGLLKGEHIGSQERGDHLFRILTRTTDGAETYHSADIVIDTSGVYGTPNWLGTGGIPALGETQSQAFIDYHLPDLYGKDRERFAGKKTLLVGAGYSAATAVCDFENLIREEPETSLLWIVKSSGKQPVPPIADDPLAGRSSLTRQANQIAAANNDRIRFLSSTTVDSIYYRHADNSFEVGLRQGDKVEMQTFDRVIATVGFGPDNSLYRELQVHECYASRGPMKLAATLLGASTTDCMTQESAGADSLKNPEPDFYILGNKSYGRNPTFLLRIGLQQIVEVFALITGDSIVDLNSRLVQQAEQQV